MSTKTKKPKIDHLEELKQKVLAMEASSSHGDVREAMRQVAALIADYQSR